MSGPGIAKTSTDGRTVTVHIPLAFKRRGGRKRVVAPRGAPAWALRSARVDTALVKALARAYRWQALLEEGTYSSIQELAAAEQINPSYVSRVLRLTLLAPNIVDAILDGKAEDTITLGSLMKPFSVEWKGQSGLELVRQ